MLRPASLPNRVKHALEAFTDLLPASEDYSYELSFKSENAPVSEGAAGVPQGAATFP